MMRHIFGILFLSVISIAVATGQIFEPVKWTTSFQKISENEYELKWSAQIEPGWTIYSQYPSSKDDYVMTSFTYEDSSAIEFVGKNIEASPHLKTAHDPVLDMKMTKMTESATFTQKVKVKDPSKPIKGILMYTSCDNTKCLPPTDVPFEFNFQGTAAATDKAVDSGNKNQNILNPVKWSVEAKEVGNNEYDLIFTAKVDEGWNVYSQFLKDDGPRPTKIIVAEGTHYSITSKPTESGSHMVKEHDPNFDMELVKFKGDATFIQRIKINDPSQKVKGELEYMTCDNSKCLFPDPIPFEFDPATKKASLGNDEADHKNVSDASGLYPINNVDLDNPVSKCSIDNNSNIKKETSIWNIFFLGFAGGLVALLTPCVFPMIPLTVSFFTKSSKNKKKGITNAVLYGFFIFLVYLILSIPFHLLDSISPDILNEISTNIWLNLAFFVIFIFFAFSFFGYYELTLPSSLTNKVSSAEGVGGIFGIFFMALTLALVSFSCTGPILGSLLAGALSSDGGAMQLTSGMAGFGLALALPFALFAMFPGWMNSLPKSGGWLNTVKVVLGFLELALALKFFSNADLVKHWGVLKIELFLGLWILIFLGMGLYLFGKIKFPHDSPLKKLSFFRISTGVLAIAFAVYLMSGFRYNEETGTFKTLTFLSGLAPSAGYSWIHPKQCPGNLDCFHNLEEGVAYAKKVNKPILIDFTGYACVNCRKMEENVWPKKAANDLIKNDFVLVSLYVDDKTALPQDQKIAVKQKNGSVKNLKDYGNKWAHFQTENFNNNSQPYYALITAEGKLLNSPVGYTPDVNDYVKFLQCGLDAFKSSGSTPDNGSEPQIGER